MLANRTQVLKNMVGVADHWRTVLRVCTAEGEELSKLDAFSDEVTSFRQWATDGLNDLQRLGCLRRLNLDPRWVNFRPAPTITIDKSGANTAAILDMCADSGVNIEMRQSKYLNNLIEQDHRAIKRIVRPMLGFKSFRCARALIAGIETMHMIKKGQLDSLKDRASSAADEFYSLAF